MRKPRRNTAPWPCKWSEVVQHRWLGKAGSSRPGDPEVLHVQNTHRGRLTKVISDFTSLKVVALLTQRPGGQFLSALRSKGCWAKADADGHTTSELCVSWTLCSFRSCPADASFDAAEKLTTGKIICSGSSPRRLGHSIIGTDTVAQFSHFTHNRMQYEPVGNFNLLSSNLNEPRFRVLP